jgi:Ca2+-binding EF-hand superfamily protein
MTYSDAQLVDRFRQRLAARGSRGISGIGRQFKIMDDNNSGTVCLEEFKKGMHDFRIGLTPSDSERLFKIFDTQKNGNLSYDEFLYGIRGEMNDFRKNICAKAFKIMDNDGSGVINIDDVRHKYNAKMSPDVISGKKTEDEVLFEFLDTFDVNHTNNKNGGKDANIDLNEWFEYYNNVSMSVDDDAYFELMMNNAWNLDGSKVTKKGWGGAL